MAKTPQTNGPFAPRTREANRPSARKRIFDTASGLFYLKGIRAVGVETIAQGAKTTKMSLYRSFPSKDELVVLAAGSRHQVLADVGCDVTQISHQSPQATQGSLHLVSQARNRP